MNDDHLPAENQTCEVCSGDDHVWCMPTVLAETTSDVSPMIALHDADLAVNGEAAA